MANDNCNDAKPTTDPRFPGKTVALPPARSYMVGPSFGPLARSIGETTTKILSEIVRGGDDDLNAGR